MTVAFGTVSGRTTAGTTSITGPLAGSIAAGDMLLLAVVVKPETATVTTPAGWLPLADIQGGTGTIGPDVGQTRTVVFSRIADGTEASQTITVGNSPDSVTTQMMRCTKAAGLLWSIAAATAAETVHATGWSVTATSDPGIANGDLVVIWSGDDTDTATGYTSPTITATGVTFGALSQRVAQGGTTTGNQCGSNVHTVSATAGASTAAPAHTKAAGPSACGETVFIRLREITPPLPVVSQYTAFF